MSNIVFNSDVELYGQRYIQKIAPIPANSPNSDIVKRELLALLFEQFLLFDKIAVKIERDNLSLYFLIKELGLNKVEELLEKNTIQLVLWTPLIATLTGPEKSPNNRIDHDMGIGLPPLIAGNYNDEGSDPEKNIDRLLSNFSGITRERKRIFKRKALRQYTLPSQDISKNAVEIVIDAYKHNRLSEFDLPFEKEPEQLNFNQRGRLLNLGSDILETSVLAEKQYKSYNNYNYYKITENSIRYIKSAINASINTDKILQEELVPNIKSVFLDEKIPFEKVFDLRKNKNIKQYRKWINDKSISVNQEEIIKEYIDAIADKKGYFDKGAGKFIRSAGMFVASEFFLNEKKYLIPGEFVSLGLSMFDSYVISALFKGWNPRMFIDTMKLELKNNEN